MNPIQKALRHVQFHIPREVLMAAFVRREFGNRSLPISLETRIREEVIEPIVLPDCDLVGGTEVDVNLSTVNAELVDVSSHVLRIPKELTQYRSITQVYSINLLAGAMNGTSVVGLNGYSDALGAGMGVMSAASTIPTVSNAHVKLIGENTILITYNSTIPRNISLRCRLANDEEMSQLRSTSYHRFAELVLLAVKTYIYTNLNIRIGDVELQGGMELGRFREYVDSCADAGELYQTYLDETWRKTAIFDDAVSSETVVRQLIGGHQ